KSPAARPCTGAETARVPTGWIHEPMGRMESWQMLRRRTWQVQRKPAGYCECHEIKNPSRYDRLRACNPARRALSANKTAGRQPNEGTPAVRSMTNRAPPALTRRRELRRDGSLSVIRVVRARNLMRKAPPATRCEIHEGLGGENTIR